MASPWLIPLEVHSLSFALSPAGVQVPEHDACTGQPSPPASASSRYSHQQPLLLSCLHRFSLLLVQARHKPNRGHLTSPRSEICTEENRASPAQSMLARGMLVMEG